LQHANHLNKQTKKNKNIFKKVTSVNKDTTKVFKSKNNKTIATYNDTNDDVMTDDITNDTSAISFAVKDMEKMFLAKKKVYDSKLKECDYTIKFSEIQNNIYDFNDKNLTLTNTRNDLLIACKNFTEANDKTLTDFIILMGCSFSVIVSLKENENNNNNKITDFDFIKFFISLFEDYTETEIIETIKKTQKIKIKIVVNGHIWKKKKNY
jgi:hypothetical protein